MEPTRRTKLTRLLQEVFEDDAEDHAEIAAELRTWATDFEAYLERRAVELWTRPRPRDGRPRARIEIEDGTDPAFLPRLLAFLEDRVKEGRRLARKKQNKTTFLEALASGNALLGPFYSPTEKHAEAFRQRFANVVFDRNEGSSQRVTPREAAAQLALWYGSANDSLEEARRLLDRMKKRGKTPA